MADERLFKSSLLVRFLDGTAWLAVFIAGFNQGKSYVTEKSWLHGVVDIRMIICLLIALLLHAAMHYKLCCDLDDFAKKYYAKN